MTIHSLSVALDVPLHAFYDVQCHLGPLFFNSVLCKIVFTERNPEKGKLEMTKTN